MAKSNEMAGLYRSKHIFKVLFEILVKTIFAGVLLLTAGFQRKPLAWRYFLLYYPEAVIDLVIIDLQLKLVSYELTHFSKGFCLKNSQEKQNT